MVDYESLIAHDNTGSFHHNFGLTELNTSSDIACVLLWNHLSIFDAMFGAWSFRLTGLLGWPRYHSPFLYLFCTIWIPWTCASRFAIAIEMERLLYSPCQMWEFQCGRMEEAGALSSCNFSHRNMEREEIMGGVRPWLAFMTKDVVFESNNTPT